MTYYVSNGMQNPTHSLMRQNVFSDGVSTPGPSGELTAFP